MKLNVLALALAASAFGALSANAQTVIEERRDPGVVIEQERPADRSVTIEKRDGLFGTEKKSTTVETTGSGDCTTKTVRKENFGGSKTVTKSNCD
jgi:hypothetical protein